jgi:hypothetical protein
MDLHPDVERVALLGWHLYPQARRGRAACIKSPTDQATDDLDRLAAWTREFPGCNWRMVLGPSRVFGLDCDVPPGHQHDGVQNLAELVKVHGALPPRPTARSGGGGLFLAFSHVNGEKIIGEAGHPAIGIDPRRGRQSQTIPPSIHHTTRQPYRWLIPPWETAPPPAPAWLLRLVEPPPEPEVRRAAIDTSDAARRTLYRAANAVAQAVPGGRNDTLNRRAHQIGRMIAAGLLGEQEGVQALYGAARQAGLPHPEARATIVSGINSGIRRGANA